jgi:diadenosine tetraphosphate (Ap4A) HIT family hydrolase
MTKPCRFCHLPAEEVIFSNELALAFDDSFPVSPGHALVIPRRHAGSWFELTGEERLAMLELLDKLQARIVESRRPAAFNIGINDGKAAGQSVPHVHIHLMPRYEGDRADPRGGVRWILPDKAAYWDRK